MELVGSLVKRAVGGFGVLHDLEQVLVGEGVVDVDVAQPRSGDGGAGDGDGSLVARGLDKGFGEHWAGFGNRSRV